MPTRSAALLLFLLAFCAPLSAATSDEAVKSLQARGAKIKKDKAGRVTEVNLAEAEVGLDQLQLLASFPELNRLTLWGADKGRGAGRGKTNLSNLVSKTKDHSI